MDELSMMAVPEPSSFASGGGGVILFQQVTSLREGLIIGRDWNDVAQQQKENIFDNITDRTDQDLHKIADLYADEFAEAFLDPRQT